MNILYATCYLDVSGVTRINLDILRRISGEFTIHLCETLCDKELESSWDRLFAEEFGEPLKLCIFPKKERYVRFLEFLQQRRISLIYVTHALWVYEHVVALKRDIPGLKIVDSLHLLEPYCFRGGYPDISANRFVHPYIDKSIVISKELLRYIEHNYVVDAQKFVVIRNGIDTEWFNRDNNVRENFRSAIGVSPETVLIGFVGRMAEQKRPLLFLEVARSLADRMKNVHFYMMGGGPLETAVRTHAKRLGMTGFVTFLPPREDVQQVMNSTDLLLVTSSYEGAPLVILEALAVGVPVVSSEVGAIAEYVGNSCLVRPQRRSSEVWQFTEAVLKRLNNPISVEFDREKFSLAYVANRYADVFRAAIMDDF